MTWMQTTISIPKNGRVFARLKPGRSGLVVFRGSKILEPVNSTVRIFAYWKQYATPSNWETWVGGNDTEVNQNAATFTLYSSVHLDLSLASPRNVATWMFVVCVCMCMCICVLICINTF